MTLSPAPAATPVARRGVYMRAIVTIDPTRPGDEQVFVRDERWVRYAVTDDGPRAQTVMTGRGVAETEFEIDCLHWRGKVLTGKKAHYCFDWDELPVDETCEEFASCGCFELWENR